MSVFLFDYATSFAYRVLRKANGITRVRYYSCMKKKRTGGHRRASPKEMECIRANAEKYDAKLAEWQRREQRKGLAEARPSRRNNTGVRGIRFGNEIQYKRGRRYEWPAFIVCCADLQGKHVARAFTISAHGHEGAWIKAVSLLSHAKQLSDTETDQLVARMPDPLARLTLAWMGADRRARCSSDPVRGYDVFAKA